VHISVYPNTVKFVESKLEALKQMAKDGDVTLVLKYFTHFRIAYRDDVGDKDLTQRIYTTCQIGNLWQCLTLEGSRLYRCPQAAHILGFTTTYSNGMGSDFLDVTDISSAQEVAEWLLNAQALVSCQACAGSVGTLLPHQQLRSNMGLTTLSQGMAIDVDYIARLGHNLSASNGCMEREMVVHSRLGL
jgi:hypothetical protein